MSMLPPSPYQGRSNKSQFPGTGIGDTGLPVGVMVPGTPEEVYQASQERQLPAAPPSVKKATAFDKEHLSNTLLKIGQGFLSSNDFFQGLGAAGGAIADQNELIRKRSIPKVEYGGPNDLFEITRDGEGRVTNTREVPEFRKAFDEAERVKKAPSLKDEIGLRASAVYAIGKMDPAQRPAAWNMLVTNPQMFGLSDASGLPQQWDDTFASIAAPQGMSVGDIIGATQKQDETMYKRGQDNIRNGQNERRLNLYEKFGGKGASTNNLFPDLDY